MIEPLVLGIETSCDETGVGIVRGHTLLADASPPASTSTRASAGWCPRSRPARTWRRWCRPCAGRWPRPASRAGRRRRDRGHRRARARRRAAGRRRGGQGVRAGAGQAALRGEPPRRARRRRPAGARPAARAVRSRCSSPAGTRRCCWCPTSPATCDRSARPSTTRRARRSTRSPGCSGCGFPGGPPIDRAAPRGRPGGDRVPARADRRRRTPPFDFSFSGLKTAVARWVEARERAGEPVPVADVAASFQEAVVDVLTAQGGPAPAATHGVDHLLIGGGVAANSRLRALAAERCAAAGHRGCGCRGRGCAPTTARWSPRSARRLVAAAAAPSVLDLPGRLVAAGDHRRRLGSPFSRSGRRRLRRGAVRGSPRARRCCPL